MGRPLNCVGWSSRWQNEMPQVLEVGTTDALMQRAFRAIWSKRCVPSSFNKMKRKRRIEAANDDGLSRRNFGQCESYSLNLAD